MFDIIVSDLTIKNKNRDSKLAKIPNFVCRFEINEPLLKLSGAE